MLVWIDLEMTGLDHTSDVIVEIATLITDDNLEILAEVLLYGFRLCRRFNDYQILCHSS